MEAISRNFVVLIPRNRNKLRRFWLTSVTRNLLLQNQKSDLNQFETLYKSALGKEHLFQMGKGISASQESEEESHICLREIWNG